MASNAAESLFIDVASEVLVSELDADASTNAVGAEDSVVVAKSVVRKPVSVSTSVSDADSTAVSVAVSTACPSQLSLLSLPPKQPPPALLHTAFQGQYQSLSTPTQSFDGWIPPAVGQP